MNNLQILDYQSSPIRMIGRDGELWWVLKDVCEAFGESNYRRVSGRLDEDEKGVSQINTPGGMQNMVVVSESGLYATLFYMQPEKARGVSDEYVQKRIEQLRSFRRWVTHEVLPSIRRTGTYSTVGAKPKRMSGLELLELRRSIQMLDYQGSTIRVVQWQNQPWFSVADVARAIGTSNPYCTSRKLDRSEIAQLDLGTAGNASTQCVSRSGLTTILLRSTKPGAIPLLDWLLNQCS